MKYIASTILMGAMLLSLVVAPAVKTSSAQGDDDKGRVTICHVTGNGDYETLTISENGLNGHFNDDGTPLDGHSGDFMGPCPVDDTSDNSTPDNSDDADCPSTIPSDGGLPVPNDRACQPNNPEGGNERVTICHVAGNTDDPANFITITISVNGLNGHFNDDGSPLGGHENDTMGPCPQDASDPTNEFVPIEVGAAACVDELVYHTNQTGDWEIFRLSGDATVNPNLSQGVDAVDVSPTFAPDKQWVAFVSNRDGDWELFVSNIDGTYIQQLTFNRSAEIDPIWSPDGTQIAYQTNRHGGWAIYSFNVSTGEETALVDDGHNNTNPSWSADGSQLAYQSYRGEGTVRQLYTLNLANGEISQLTSGDFPNVDAQYSPTNTHISYRGLNDAGHWQLYLMQVDGSNVQAITDANMSADNQAWSADGTLLAYEAIFESQRHIFVYELASGQTRQLTADNAPSYAPTWFCGTTVVVFTSDVTGDANLFGVAALPLSDAPLNLTSGDNQLTTNSAEDVYPLGGATADEDASRPSEIQ